LVATIEFVTIAVALFDCARGATMPPWRVAAGVFVLTDLHWASDPLGLSTPASMRCCPSPHPARPSPYARRRWRGGTPGRGDGDRLAVSCRSDSPGGSRVRDPLLVLAGIGVGICSSVIPYVSDQLAMSRLPRNSFALMLALLPATATVIGALVLAQIPTARDLLGIALVMAGIALHRPPNGA
jgi:inner membrane transporter RhtA